MQKKNTERCQSFDFDYWVELAKNDPVQFEEKRSAAIEEMIATAPQAATRDRLRKLQWRVDAERRTSKNPTQACLKIYNMMWEKVYGGNGLLHSLNTLLEYNAGKTTDHKEKKEQKSAKILIFPEGT
ncbi:MAG: DUF3135 domain-containing protein [Gammaproteobacteria bacterium]|nr:DUF3135 domain-containing protein [Gammaproteobacteria bacterium]